jgi:pilus assembly protein Flp/PilA
MQFISNALTNLMIRIQDAKREAGQTLVEYGLLIALIAIAAIAVLIILGPQIAATFQEVSDELPGGGGGAEPTT